MVRARSSIDRENERPDPTDLQAPPGESNKSARGTCANPQIAGQKRRLDSVRLDMHEEFLNAGSAAGGTIRSGWDTRHPNRVLANAIAGNNAEWWPGAGKIRLAAAKHERAEVEAI